MYAHLLLRLDNQPEVERGEAGQQGGRGAARLQPRNPRLLGQLSRVPLPVLKLTWGTNPQLHQPIPCKPYQNLSTQVGPGLE